MTTTVTNDAGTGYLSADGFVGKQSNGNPNSPTYNPASFPNGTTQPSGTYNAQGGVTLAAKGASQASATPITGGFVLATATTSAQGFVLSAATGREVTVFAPLTLNTKVYPQLHGFIDAGASNAAQVVSAAKGTTFWCYDGVHWRASKGA